MSEKKADINNNNIPKEKITTNIPKNSDENSLLLRLKEIHCKSEERTFDLNDKINQIKEDFQKIIDNYKIEYEKYESDNIFIDFNSINDYINEYLSNERDSTITNINNIFGEVSNNIEAVSEDNSKNLNEIKIILNEIKTEFDKNYEDSANHIIEVNSQKDEIYNKLNAQMNEQFSKIFDIINEEDNILKNKEIEWITSIQNLLLNLVNQMKREKYQK